MLSGDSFFFNPLVLVLVDSYFLLSISDISSAAFSIIAFIIIIIIGFWLSSGDQQSGRL